MAVKTYVETETQLNSRIRQVSVVWTLLAGDVGSPYFTGATAAHGSIQVKNGGSAAGTLDIEQSIDNSQWDAFQSAVGTGAFGPLLSAPWVRPNGTGITAGTYIATYYGVTG